MNDYQALIDENLGLVEEVAILERTRREQEQTISKQAEIIVKLSERRVHNFAQIDEIRDYVIKKPGLSAGRIARDLNIDADHVVSSLQMLKKAKKLKTTYTKDGNVWVDIETPERPNY